MGSDDRDRKSRDRDRDRDRDRRRSKSRSRSRSRSRSPKKEGRRRKSLFDVGPAGGAAPPVAAAAAGFSAAPPVALPAVGGFSAAPTSGFSAAPAGFSAPGLPPPPAAFPGMMPGMGMPAAFPGMPGSVPGFPNMTSMPMSAPPSQQATRHARRVYVGGLPPTAGEQSIAMFFSSALAAVGGNSAGPGGAPLAGNAVVNVYINKEKNFAFVEFRTVEETSNAMALDGIMFEGVSVRVRRPNDYNPAAAAALGPSAPNPALNLAAIGLGAGKGSAPDGMGMLAPSSSSSTSSHQDPNRIFVGGIPHYLTEEQCRELLGSFGQLKTFNLIKDMETGMNKGYGFCVYLDPAVTDIAIAGLNGLKMGERTLTVRRAEQNAATAAGGFGAAAPISFTPAMPAMAAMAVPAAAAVPMVGSRIVVLQEAVTIDELRDDDEYKDIVDDMRDECAKHGALRRVIIPRPTPTVQHPPGAGKVIIEYEDMASAMRARNAMHGRKFGGRTVVATYLPEDKYLRGEFDAATM